MRVRQIIASGIPPLRTEWCQSYDLSRGTWLVCLKSVILQTEFPENYRLEERPGFSHFNRPLGITCNLVTGEESSRYGATFESQVVLNQFVLPRAAEGKAYSVPDSNPLYYQIILPANPSKVNFNLILMEGRIPITENVKLSVLAHYYKSSQ